MRQRITRIGLILLALLVWGAVVVRALKKPSDLTAPAVPHIVSSAPPPTLEDTIPRLRLIRYPFLDETVEKKPSSSIGSPPPLPKRSNKAYQPAQTQKASPKPWPTIKYRGSMRAKASETGIAFITMNGKEVIAKEGKEIEGLQVVSITPDSVIVEWLGERKGIPKE